MQASCVESLATVLTIFKYIELFVRDSEHDSCTKAAVIRPIQVRQSWNRGDILLKNQPAAYNARIL